MEDRAIVEPEDSGRKQQGRTAQAFTWLFENISEASKNGRALYFLLFGCLGYFTLAVLNTPDRSVVLNDAVKLPLLDIELPLTAFFVTAPIMALILFVFFQLYLNRLHGLVGAVREYAQTPRRRLYPWMLNIAEDPEPGFVGSLQKFVVTFSL